MQIGEPPFFISDHDRSGFPNVAYPSVPDNKQYGGFTNQDSENEDLRDVIDDLTIENRNLKQLLKRQKSQQHTDARDKLFELRVHDLPSGKKRQLERLLRDFASNLNVETPPSFGPFTVPISGARPPPGYTQKDAKHVQTDSGYVSNSASGQTSATPSNPGRPAPTVSKRSNDRSVKSYLHNIPNGLLPKQPLVMSENSRMALVVRKLENLFTGKHAAPGEHSQPLQQQEVSQLAANADRQRANKPHRHEGTREAHILPFDSTVNLDDANSPKNSPLDKLLRQTSKSDTSDVLLSDGVNSAYCGSRSPDQRPTRPLDLDIHRAQIAQENIQYIRHLGLPLPKLDGGSGEPDEGWIYLNLLTSMAQLHTVNVTQAFIRKSIKKLSTKFELSKDGQKVRWKGGSDATQLPSELFHHPDLVAETSPSDIDHRETSIAGRASITPSDDKSSFRLTSISSKPQLQKPTTSNFLASIRQSPAKPASALDYKPILFTGRSLGLHNLAYVDESIQSRNEDTSMEDSNDSSKPEEHLDNGPIVFYNSPLFCSDLSGDRSPTNMRRPVSDRSNCPLGVNLSGPGKLHETRDPNVTYFRKSTLASIAEQPLGGFTLEFPPVTESGETEGIPMELQASGIGGVTPQDNFIMDVKIERRPLGVEPAAAREAQKRREMYKYQVDACSRIDLPASLLPPPSYIFFQSSSSSNMGEVSSSEDEGTDPSIDEHQPAPPMFLTYFLTQSSEPKTGVPDADSDSIDMLASARAYHPSIVAAQERDFELNNKSTPLDAAATVASLAATAGNGSDASASNMDMDTDTDTDTDEAGSYTDTDIVDEHDIDGS